MSRPFDPRLVRAAPALRTLVAVLGMLNAIAALLVVGQALVLADIVVTIFNGVDGAHAVLSRLVVLGAIGMARAVLTGACEVLGQRASTTVRAQLRRRALDAVVRLGPLWVRSQAPGRVVNVTGPGLDALDGYVTRAVPALVSATVVPPVVLTTILVTDWQAGVILLVLLPLVPVFMSLVGMTTNRLVQRQHQALERLSGQFLDLLRGLRTLRVYGRVDAQQHTLERVTDEFRRRTVASLRVAFLSGLVLDLIAALSVAVVAVDIGLRLDSGHVGFGVALTVLLLAPEVFAPLRAMGAQHHASQDGAAAAGAALDIIDAATDCDEVPGRVGARAGDLGADGELRATGVSVTYPGRVEPALLEITTTIAPGQVVALTGPSGAGKSTLLAALLGMVPVSGGHLEWGRGGAPRLEDTAWLPQRPRPTQPTVADEVRLGDPVADDRAVQAACAATAAPHPGTPLAEDGLGVSAGQRRRIGLARVLLRVRAIRERGDIPLVLLDEPGEDLDADTELVVARVVADLRGTATVLLATHSHVLAGLADVRLGLAGGRLVERVEQSPVPPPPTADAAPVRDARPATVAARPAVADFRLRDLVRLGGVARRLSGAVALSGAAALTGLGLTATSMWLISRAAQHPNVQALAVAVVGVRTFAVGRALLRYAERLTTHDAALRMLAALRGQVFIGLRSLSPAVLGSYGRGDLLRRFVGDVDGAQEGLVRAAVPSAGAAAGALGSVALATALAPAAGLVLGAGLLVAGLVGPACAVRQRAGGYDLTSVAGMRDRRAADLIEGLDELMAYGFETHTVGAVGELDAQFGMLARRPARAAAVGAAGTGAAAALTLPLVLAAAAAAVARGALPVVDVGVLTVCAMTGFETVAALPAALVAWTRCRAGLHRVAEVTARDGILEFGDVACPAGPLGLSAESLSVAPAPGAADALSGASFTLHAGARLAVVGPSGCGKSTLLAAALRLLPARGNVRVTAASAAVAVTDLASSARAMAVAGSLQGDHVFDVTLRDNLRVVRPDANDTDLDVVAARVGLQDLIRSLPGGWSTPAGPDGAAISGGQRQRLLVARALLADPAVLVLDEPTAHLDIETERRVLTGLLDATVGRTVLMTTHRDIAAGVTDRILRIEGRRLVVADVGDAAAGRPVAV